ncbi:Hypothetical protein CINCED_3A017481 [Cinara cedri]|uniref:Uncharacterized protein n=1 Tax=Cinara cedri TaxID=506608 RepID=A0A5E4NR67_9HEMI|nr:Hypothetical protein CINCED_3A017481 [Cinara cedri]
MLLKFIVLYVIFYSLMSLSVHGDGDFGPDFPFPDPPDNPPFTSDPGNPSIPNVPEIPGTPGHRHRYPDSSPPDDCGGFGCCPSPCRRNLTWAEYDCNKGYHIYEPEIPNCYCCN